MSMARIPGARFSFVVVSLNETVGTVMRDVVKVTEKGIIREPKEQPAGFMVYFPRGHALRVKDEAMLKQYGLDKEPRIINMSGLSDPNSPVGKMMMAQDENVRRGAYEDLEKMVIRLATAKSGHVLMPEQMEAA